MTPVKQITFDGSDYRPMTRCPECKKHVPCLVLQDENLEDECCCICLNKATVPESEWENYPELFCEECWKQVSDIPYSEALNND